MKRALLEVET